MLTSCGCDDWATGNDTPTKTEQAAARPLVAHEVTVSLDDESTRVAYTPNGEGLQLSWEENETLGVYIRCANDEIIYAGQMSGNGTEGDRGARRFSGEVSEKQDNEQYLYIHPAPTGDNQALGKIGLSSQSGALGSSSHLNNYIPLVWEETSKRASIQGYAVHLQLSFNEDPGTISEITLQTMSMAGADHEKVFPKEYSITQVVSGAHGAEQCTGSVKLTLPVESEATKDGDLWKADVYLASTNATTNVFRTKYHAEVTASNGTFHTDYLSFPGQQSATDSKLAMLANGDVYNLTAPASKGTAMTVISDEYKVNSLLGMWNQYGKAYDPASLIVTDKSKWPSQLSINEAAIRSKTISTTTPTFLGPTNGSLYATGRQTDLKQESVSFNNIQITEDTEVFFTIVSEYGWNQNLIGYYHYPTANESSVTSRSVTKSIIFADVSKPDNEPFAKGLDGHQDKNNVGVPADAPIQEFETVKLLYSDARGFTSTIFPKGTTIGFMMMIDPEANAIEPSSTGYNPRIYDLMRWNQWRLFTNTAWNAENTIANGAASNWPSTGYTYSNFFCSGDVCNGAGSPIQGLAIYGVKDNGINNAVTAYGAMIFMVSTSNPASMQTQNKAYFNIGTTGDQIIAK